MENKTCVECRYLGSAKETGLCEKRKICLYPEELPACNCFEQKPKMTNGDKIRQMGDKELAHIFAYPCPPDKEARCCGGDNEQCEACWLEWLESEMKGEQK